MAYNEIQFKGFKLINANGNNIDDVLHSYSGTAHAGILYLVRTDPKGKDGYFILNGKVYGSGEKAKALIADLDANLNEITKSGGTIDTKINTAIEGLAVNFSNALDQITNSGGTIDTKINTAIEGLDATASTSGTTYISGTTVEENGKLTSFTIDETALNTKIGQIDNAITAITADTATINTRITDAINGLDKTVSGTSTHSGITVTIEQVDGKLSGVTVTDTLGTASNKNVAEGTLSLPTGETSSTKDGLTTAAQVENFVKASVADLTGAMHFVGAVTGGTENYNGPKKSGDVIIVTDTKKEYVYDGSKWVELGDEGLYVTKSTTIAELALQNNISKTDLLTALNVKDGAQVNKIEGVQVNGTELTPDGEKKVNITVATGKANGTIKVNDADVAVAGLKSAAYKDETYFDKAGTATAEIAAISGTTSGTSTNSYVTVATTQDHGKVAGITVNDSALKEAITGITNDINTLSGTTVTNVNNKTGNTITLTGVDIAVGADVNGDGTMTANNKVSEVLADIYTKLNTANANAYTGITAADNTVTVSGTTHGHSVAVNLKTLSDTEKASGLIQLVSAKDGSGIYGKLFFDGTETDAPAVPH